MGDDCLKGETNTFLVALTFCSDARWLKPCSARLAAGGVEKPLGGNSGLQQIRHVIYDNTSDACMVHSSKAVTPSMRCKRILVDATACSCHAPDIRATFVSCISHIDNAYLVLTL